MKKPLRYSHHAETVMRERQLLKDWVEVTVRRPLWTEPDPAGNGTERRFAAVAERNGRYLRVVCVETADEIRIISAFLDRGARRP
jgi:uncharacterized DUF497 family protein